MEEIKMTRQEFFIRLSQGEIGAWTNDMEPDEFCIDGVIHCFGNDDVHIALTVGDEGESYYSYWAADGVWIELMDISHN